MYDINGKYSPIKDIALSHSRVMDSNNQYQRHNQSNRHHHNQYYIQHNSRMHQKNFSQLYQPTYQNSRIQYKRQNNGLQFGKQREKIANYVLKQFSKDQQNKKVLQKFRLDAIRQRNYRSYGKRSSIPYITQSMVPGVNLDASEFRQKPKLRPLKKYINFQEPIKRQMPCINPEYSQIHHQYPQQIHYYPEYHTLNPSPQKIQKNRKKSIAIQANFQKQFPLKKKKKKRLYTIQDSRQMQNFAKIDEMISQISQQLDYNKSILKINTKNNQSRPIAPKIIQQIPPNRKIRRYFTQSTEITQTRKPSVQYDTSNIKLKDGNIRKASIKDHLQLLKKNKKRLEDLDSYIYQC